MCRAELSRPALQQSPQQRDVLIDPDERAIVEQLPVGTFDFNHHDGFAVLRIDRIAQFATVGGGLPISPYRGTGRSKRTSPEGRV
jgi:hypothetical protein